MVLGPLPQVPAARAGADELAALGTGLAQRGLTERAVRACFGVACVGHAPLRAAAQGPRTVPSPAAVTPWLFVAGRPVPRAMAERQLGLLLDQLGELGFVQLNRDAVTARVCIVPAGPNLCVTDRLTSGGDDVVAMPDDSAYHLLGALPPHRVSRWLDVGTGCGIVPLSARGARDSCRATDTHERSIRMARLGAQLSGSSSIELHVADLLEGARDAAWDLVTFNAPIPAAAGVPATTPYRSTAGRHRLLHEFWDQARRALAPGGEVLMHSWIPEDEWQELALPGNLTIACYTPPSSHVRFGVTRWQPDADAGHRVVPVSLTPSRPHVRRDDFSAT